MESLFRRYFNPDDFGAPYEEPEEHLLDLVYWVREALDGWNRLYGQKENQPMPEAGREKWVQDLDKSLFHMDARVSASVKRGDFLAVQYVRELFHLTDLEVFTLILYLLPRYDESFGPLLGKGRGEGRQTGPSLDMALKLFHLARGPEDVPGYHRQRHQLEKKAFYAFLQKDGTLDKRMADFLLQNGREPLEREVAETFLPQNAEALLWGEEEARHLAETIAGDGEEKEPLFLCLRGPSGVGRTTRAKRVAQLLGIPAVIFSCAPSPQMRREDFFDALRTAGRETILVQGMLVLRQLDALLEEPDTARQVLDMAGMFSGAVLLLCGEEGNLLELSQGRRWLEVPIALPDKKASIALWQRELSALPLKEPVDGAEMANKFTFTPAQIVGTGQRAAGEARLHGPLGRQDVTRAAYHQVSHKLGEHATLIYARHTWDQLVLGQQEKEMLRMACDQVRYQHVVYDKWGFDKRLAYGKGVSMLFAGPPGTGKTMAAQVVASDLGIEMYKVDLSQVVSKYIGETEKNLNQVFSEAKKSNVILFFDETDAILGKRTEVKDSHDKNANLETAYLLQKMEEYDGITVMTTNYKENIDSAFFRRISYVIHFSFPDEKARRAIWKGIFPQETPLGEDVDLDYLARQFSITGGSIKNIALVASFMAARKDVPVGMEHILRATQFEMAKQGKIMLREDYGEYGYLLP